MRLKILSVPDKRLRQKSLPVTTFSLKEVIFLSNLAETLVTKDNPPGVGLSAVQVGELQRVFVTYLPPVFDLKQTEKKLPPAEIKFFINPEIIDHSEATTLGDDPKNPALEGCLSVPSLYGPVLRYQTIKVRYQTFAGSLDSQVVRSLQDKKKQSDDQTISLPDVVLKTDTFSHFYARVIQHEYDHLEGILFTDHIKTDNHGLYFDQGNQLAEIANPLELIRW